MSPDTSGYKVSTAPPEPQMWAQDNGSIIFSDPKQADDYAALHPEIFGKKPAAPAAPVSQVAPKPIPATPKPAAEPSPPPVVAPEDLDAFTDYMYKTSQQGGLQQGQLPVKFDSTTASPDYKSKLVKGNPNTYLAWKAKQPEVAKVYGDADASADIQKAEAESEPAPATETPEATPESDKELAAEMYAKDVNKEPPELNESGTAPEGETKASFGAWLKDKFGKKADKLDFWDAMEIWGAALAGNEPRMYMGKMQRLKEAKDYTQRTEELQAERDFQTKLQEMLSDRETNKLLAMQDYERGQTKADQEYRTGEAQAGRTFTGEQNAADRALEQRRIDEALRIQRAAADAAAWSPGAAKPAVDPSVYE